MKLLTFLGKGVYSQTEYVWGERSHTARFAPVATTFFLKPDIVTVFLTEAAQQETYPNFQAAMQKLPKPPKLQPIAVPKGSNESELWQIFEQVSTSVSPDEIVAFDITHGLRSSPLIGLLVAAFLRSGLGIDLRAVLYGAYDVRDKTMEPNRTPVFDLSPMLALLEWAVAADRFNRTGDARYLGSLLEEQRTKLAKTAEGNHDLENEAGRLGNLAGALTGISQSLRLIRPFMATESIAGLKERVKLAEPALERAAAARPFSLILNRIVDTYQPLGIAEKLSEENLKEYLATQRKMIFWYVEREQWVQAVSLAREWLVSWMMYYLKTTTITDKKERERVEGVINSEAHAFLVAKTEGGAYSSIFLNAIPNAEEMLDLWNQLTDLRNDIDHAGMRQKPREPKDIIKQINKITGQLKALSL